MKGLTEDTLGIVVDSMEGKARQLGINRGASALLELKYSELVSLKRGFAPSVWPMQQWLRAPDPKKLGDMGSNYVAVVQAKVAEMIRTVRPSGCEGCIIAKGETGFLGGLVAYDTGIYTFIAFSGGEPHEDVAIARAGMEYLGLLDYLIE